MTDLLIKRYLRSKGLMAGLVLLVFVGLVSLHIGKVFLQQQEDIIDNTAIAQEEQINRHLQYVDGHIGLLLYYIRFGLANEASPISGLSIGHRDIRVPAQLVNIRNLEEQKNTHELINPLYQLLGNMDFGFVLIYLFPLVIIGLSYSLLSEEKESGTWSLVMSQSNSGLRIIKQKLVIRLLSVLLILVLLLGLAKIYLAIPLDQAFFAFSGIAITYILFWFALVWWVTSLQKSSNQNALVLLSAWIIFTIMIPAALNNLVTNLYPTPEAYGTTIESRDGYHNKWDQPKEPTIAKFKKIYPQFNNYEHPEGQSFSWFWYYAMQQMGDDEAADEVRAMKAKLQQRDRFARTVGYFLPSVHTQLSINTVSQSDLTNHLNYINGLEKFHEAKRLNFYPSIFENTSIEEENWEQFNLEYFRDIREVNWFSLLPVVIISCLLLVLARRNWLTT